MMEFKCKCDKCGFWVSIELSVAEPTCNLPDGFRCITTPDEDYTFCNSCFNKLQEKFIAAIDEFVEKGDEDV